MSSFLVPRGSSGSFVNTTGRLANPKTAAQIRAASQTSDNKSVIVYGIVAVDIPPASAVGFEITPSTSGRVQLTYNGGDALPENVVVVTNETLQRFSVLEGTGLNIIVLERRDDKYYAVSGLTSGAPFLQARNVNFTTDPQTEEVNPGDLLKVGLIDVDGIITMSSAWDTVFEPNQEFGILLQFISNPPHTLSINLANLGLNVGWYDKRGFHSTTELIVLSNVGDYVQIKSTDPGNQSWLINSDERRAHSCELEKSDTQSIPSGTITTVLFNNSTIDNGILSDVVNNRMVIQRAGTYQVSMIVGFDNPAGQTLNANGFLLVNGGLVRSVSVLPTSQNLDFVFAGTWLIDLAAGDILTAQVRHNSVAGAAQNLATSLISRCRLSVQEVR